MAWKRDHPLFEDNVARFTNARDTVDYFQRLKRPIVEVATRQRNTSVEISHMLIGTLGFYTASARELLIRTQEGSGYSVLLPTGGHGTVLSEGRRKKWWHKDSILFANHRAPTEFQFTTPFASLVVVPQPDVLARTVQVMTGSPKMTLPSQTEAISLSLAGNSLRELILSVGDLVSSHPSDYLARIGLDDVVYRLVAETLEAEGRLTELTPSPARRSRSARALDLLCDRIKSESGKLLTLTEMEAMVGLSSRSLRYAFQERFGCSPREWQRNVMLDRAREELRKDDKLWTVKELAYAFGFVSPYSFASFYRKRFGEFPSETKKTRST